MDEFDRMLYVYTSTCRLIGYKLGENPEGVKSENTALTRHIFSSDKQGHLLETNVVQMDYI